MENVITFKLNSTRPLIMQAETLANPLHPGTKAHKAVAGKRKKTEDDHLWLLKDEFLLNGYFDDKLGPYLPAINFEACLAEAAKATKQGKLVKQAVSVITDKAPLQYDGPRDPQKLYGDGGTKFVDVRGVGVMGKKVMRCRPIFLEWSAEFDVAFMPDLIDPQDLIRIVAHAGRVIGVGTYRPRFGRFDVEAR